MHPFIIRVCVCLLLQLHEMFLWQHLWFVFLGMQNVYKRYNNMVNVDVIFQPIEFGPN